MICLTPGFKGSKLGDPYTDSYFYGTPYLSSMGARTGLLDPLLAEGSLLDDPEAKAERLFAFGSSPTGISITAVKRAV